MAVDVAIQSDGKIVVAGVRQRQRLRRGALQPDGSLDTSFDGDGKVTTDIGSVDRRQQRRDAGGRQDGRGGATFTTVDDIDFAVARYNADGSLDTSFDGDGKAVTDFGGLSDNDDGATGVALQGDGKVVAAGHTDAGDNPQNFALARYTTSGGLDPSFDGDGRAVIDFEDNEVGPDVALQPDGKIVTAGTRGSETGDFALARSHSGGGLDASFDDDGKVVTDFGSFDVAAGVAIQIDGKLVAAGQTGSDFALARYNPNGSPDSTFDGDGLVVTDFGGSDQGHGVAIQPDNKIVAAGTTDAGANPGDFALARYLPGTVTPPPPPPPPADLQITKSASPEPAELHVVLTYTLRVTNNGPGTARGVRVRDELPANVQFDSADYRCTGTATVTCDLGDIPARSTHAFTIRVVPVSTGTATNTATVSSSTSDPASGNDRATVTSTITAPFGQCTITGTPGNDTLRGTAGNDVICGLGGRDYLYGGDGDDVLLPGGGEYNMSFGEMGRDTIRGGSDHEYFYGGPGDDRLIGGPAGRQHVRYSQAPGPVRVDLPNGVTTGAEGTDSLSGITGALGSQFADVLIGDGGANELYGDRGADNITGAGGDDDLRGEDGDDRLDAGAGWDYLVEYGGGQDFLDGGVGVDTVWYAAPSAVNVSLAAGTASGGAGNDVISAAERIYGGRWDDILTGDDGNNLIIGDDGADTITGRGGRDGLYGQLGDDTLLARDGQGDSLDGGQGSDRAEVDPFGLDPSIAVELFLP